MDQIFTSFFGELFKYGGPGIAIAYLIWKNRQLENDIDVKNKRIDELQEKRISEAIVTVTASSSFVASNNKMGEALESVSTQLSKNGAILSQIEKFLDGVRR